MSGTKSGMGTGQINMVWGWRELPSIDGGTTCVCGRGTERRERERKRGEKEKEREREREREREMGINTQLEQCHSLRQLVCSPLILISVGPGELLCDRTGEGESEEKESLL